VNLQLDDMKFINELYGLLLLCFPKHYREEYGEELQIVFYLSLSDALKTGGWEPAKVVLRELLSLPMAVLIQHLREGRRTNMVKNFGTYFNFAHGSWREFLSALCPFLLFGLYSPLIDLLGEAGLLVPGGRFADGMGVVLLVVMAILFLVGILSGLPRWFFPYLGFLLSIASLSAFSAFMERYDRSLLDVAPRSWIGSEIVYQGLMWGGLTVLTILLVVLINLVPFLRRFKKDWTLLAFLLYGAVPFAVMISFDDYLHDGPSRLFAFLILGAGIWFYLHTNNQHRKFWMLFGGMTVSLLFAAVAKAIIYQYFWDGLRYFTWWTEMMSTVIMWGWLALTMLISLALQRLARSQEALPAPQN
jgi:hypothetical protein